jgi:hypothetical protein
MSLLKKKVIIVLSDGSLLLSHENSFKKSVYFSFKEKDFKNLPFYQRTYVKKVNENNLKYFNKFFKI